MSIFGTALGVVSGPGRFYAELAVAGVLAVALGVQTAGKWDAEKDAATTEAAFSDYRATAEKQAREATDAARRMEQDTAERLGRISDGADKRVAAVMAAASAAAASAAGVQSRAQAYAAAARRACPGVAAAAGGGASTSDPIGVLADVLGRADARAGILATESDKRRVRALACEDSYESNRERSLKANGR